ncbi:amino acid adenylation domain-containing protein [Streptomyces sp. NPDC001828]|uniref:non-ribosomal peptide synthetase n=1 Tax=Streptomyces sp. NPDC001828 TaxID=3364615 RepID=UPI00369D4502
MSVHIGGVEESDASGKKGGDNEPFSSVPAAFAQTVKSHRHEVALVFRGQEMTYGRLAELTDGVRRLLDQQGVRPGQHVGVLLPRGPLLVATALAVMGAGAAYVPLDPLYPPERMRDMLQDAEAPLLVTGEGLTQLAAEIAAEVLVVDEARDAPARASADESFLREGHLAYLVFTSGTTGRPKAVRVRTSSFMAQLRGMRATLDFQPTDRFLALTIAAFDLSPFELFLTLVHGGTVVIATEEEADDPAAVMRLIEDTQPTLAQGTPTFWRRLIAEGWQGASGMQVICGAEDLPGELARALSRRVGTLWNCYGPSETTVWASAGHITAEGGVHIGSPTAGWAFTIVDEQLAPVPAGAAGELCIGGLGVSDGYHGRPTETQRAYVQSPDGSGLMYRTGDRVEQRADGQYVWLGRMDDQIKLNGYRIEPAEVETVLRDHHAIRDAVVLAHDASAQERVLFAHWEAAPDAPRDEGPDVGDLREHLARRLPHYMVPAQYVRHEKFPTLRNGKVDRKVLRAVQAQHVDEAGRSDASVVEAVVDAVGQVLGLPEPPGPREDFAELGVDSIVATAVAARAQRATGKPVPAFALLKHRNAHDLQASLEAEEAPVADPVPAADLLLPGEIFPPSRGPAAADEAGTIVLTGASGFVGAFLLDALRRGTDQEIICLVRADSAREADHKVATSLSRYRLLAPAGEPTNPEPQLPPQVRTLAADLEQPRLGLDSDAFDDLARSAGAIYHAAAHVNAYLPYEALAAANVHGTRELLRLACRLRASAFHLISTSAVFAPSQTPVSERDPAGPATALPSGYGQSKWVAEQLVHAAGGRGLPVTCIRLPRVLGAVTTGACQERDALWRLLKGSVLVGAAPDLKVHYPYIPVDAAADHIVDLTSNHPDEQPPVPYHLSAQEPISFVDATERLRAAGYGLRTVTADEWLHRVMADPHNPAAPLAEELVCQSHEAMVETPLDCALTQAQHTAPAAPAASGYLDRQIAHFIDSQFLPDPAATARAAS